MLNSTYNENSEIFIKKYDIDRLIRKIRPSGTVPPKNEVHSERGEVGKKFVNTQMELTKSDGRIKITIN